MLPRFSDHAAKNFCLVDPSSFDRNLLKMIVTSSRKKRKKDKIFNKIAEYSVFGGKFF